MALQLSNEGGIKAEPNVTPMIDVMLVLLIIFMIVIPQLLSGFNAIPPEGQNLRPHPNEDEDVILGIDAEGKFYLDKKLVTDEELPTRIRSIYDVRTTDKIMFIKADRSLKYARIIQAMDIAAHQGVHVAALVTDQTKGTQSLIESDNAGQDLGIGKKGGNP